MCGFLVAPASLKVAAALSLRLRGPDEMGTGFRCGFKLQSFRLSIVGQRFGKQPLTFRNSTMVYNGEIYNYKALAATHGLSQSAHESDAQCLLELLTILPPVVAIPKLVGHFAFVLADDVSGHVTFCRDHMGVKPLYFRCYGDAIVISSDIQTLVNAWPSTVSAEGALEALMFGGHAGEQTLYGDIASATPGVLYIVDHAASSVVRRHSVALSQTPYPVDVDEFMEVLKTSVHEQARVAVPAACLVSSGIDSRIVKRLVPSDQTMYFVNALSDEMSFSAEDVNEDPDTIRLNLSTAMGTEYFKTWLCAYGTVPAHNNYFALCMLYRELASDDSLNHPNRIKVAITGEGADEYFGGYGRYKQLAVWLSGQAVPWIEALQAISTSWMYLMNSRLHHSSLQWLCEQGVDCDAATRAHAARSNCDPDASASIDRLSRYDIQSNLRYGLQKQDVAGMMSSIEVRVPMVTQRVHQFAADGSMAAATPDLSKLRLQEVAARLGIIQPKKIGFPVSLESFIPSSYQPTEALCAVLPFAFTDAIPEDIRQGLFMLDVLNGCCEGES
ncbi:MAG: asparagine synthetase B family protein [Gammaproteobacteria bacterium]|nr:asparagine synthetase B family protein [Gammaproteobacteria bacterium]